MSVLHIRDTVLAITAGVAETAVITLPISNASHAIFGLSGSDGTVTAGGIALRWAALGVTYGANLNPEPAGSTAAAIDAIPRSVAGTNEFGFVSGHALPVAFTLKATSLAGTSTTLNVSLEVHQS